MNIYVLYFDGFWEQEIGLIINGFRNENIVACGLEERSYLTEGKQKVLSDIKIDDINTDDIDLLIIPRGDISDLLDNDILSKFLNELNAKGKYVAGIGSGTLLIANNGLLDNKKCTGGDTGLTLIHPEKNLFENSVVLNQDVVIDDNIITATRQSYVEFAVELYRLMNIYDNEEELMTEYRWLKNIKK